MAAPMHVPVSQYEPRENKVVVKSDVLADALKGIEDQLLVVSVIGPYQRGKSSFISHLTGDSNIKIGNGTEPQTKGVWLYGPYSLNALKQRWQVPEVPGDLTKVVFFDTEGFQGNDVGHSQEENKLIMCQMTAPYIAISQVCIMLHNANLARGSSETIRYFLDVVQRICSGINQAGAGNVQIIDISTGVSCYPTGEINDEGRKIMAKYEPDEQPESFDQICQYLRQVQRQRLTMDVGGAISAVQLVIDEYWPLPRFLDDLPISQQGPRFQAGFSLVTCRLLHFLERVKGLHAISGEGAVEAFELFTENLGQEELSFVNSNSSHKNLDQLLFPMFCVSIMRLKEASEHDQIHQFTEEFTSDVMALFSELEQRCCEFPRTPSDHEMDCQPLVSKYMRQINSSSTSESLRKSDAWRNQVKIAVDKLSKIGQAAKTDFLQKLSEWQEEWSIREMVLVLLRQKTLIQGAVTSVPELSSLKKLDMTEKIAQLFSLCKSELDSIQIRLRFSDHQKQKFWNIFHPKIAEIANVLLDLAIEEIEKNKDANQEKFVRQLTALIRVGTPIAIALLFL